MPALQYNGAFPVIYPDYVDAATGKTLTVVPGESYEPAAAPGRIRGLPAVPGDGRWGPSMSGPGWEPLEALLTELTMAPAFPAGTDPVPAAEPVTPSPESEA